MSLGNQHFPLLIIDTSSTRTWVGVARAPGELAWKAENGEAMNALFGLLKSLLAETGLKLADFKAVAYCEGPGSTLGIRIAVMAIRSWQSASSTNADLSLFAFSSLSLGALIAKQEIQSDKPLAIALDARRNSWNYLEVNDTGAASAPCIVENDDLASSGMTLFTFDEFSAWTKAATPMTSLSYRPEIAFQADSLPQLLRPVDIAAPCEARAAEYQKWQPRLVPKLSAK